MEESDREGYESDVIADQTPNTHSISMGTNRRQLFTNSESENDPQLLILRELQKTNASINNLSNRMDSIENRLISVEKEALTPDSSSSVERNKRKVPTRI